MAQPYGAMPPGGGNMGPRATGSGYTSYQAPGAGGYDSGSWYSAGGDYGGPRDHTGVSLNAVGGGGGGGYGGPASGGGAPSSGGGDPMGYGMGAPYSSDYAMGGDEDYSNEPPLLEELGINFDHIWAKTQAVILPVKHLDDHVMDDADLAGPLFFCLAFGVFLLLTGKVHFGYIYGFGVSGCGAMYLVLNLLSQHDIDIWRVCSILGYCLLPVIGLAFVGIVVSLKGITGQCMAATAIFWSTYSSTRLFEKALQMSGQRWLVAYPVGLLYSVFVLITIF